ncbi:hypothetical protein DSO57_1018572 [Entomophthora muscae]|uniref:Uncharacterized protein n=1 Tax=Entomophthora muscae TaxID=34485 RepID=A0ACC2UE33_9FUNG|nr:hypothetical protein DSO57_1018572 [Entomophthora muscae]
MVHPPSIDRFLQIIVGLIQNSSDLPLNILEKDLNQKGIIFQRCLTYLISYQPANLYASLESKCPSLTLKTSPFLSEDFFLLNIRHGVGVFSYTTWLFRNNYSERLAQK